MKMIDAKVLKDDGANYVWARFADGSYIKKEIRFVNREQIDNAPEIDAIPIDVIEKEIKRLNDDVKIARYYGGSNADKLEYVRDWLNIKLQEWRRENG